MKRPGPKVRHEPPAPIKDFERERASRTLGELPMVLLVAKAVIHEEHFAPALALSFEHVNRSRAQAQCIDHAVYRDLDDRRRLVFLGQWFDRDALLAHLRLPESIVFTLALEGLAAEKPHMATFDVTQDSAA